MSHEVEKFQSVKKWLGFRCSTPASKEGYITKIAYFLKISKINPDKPIQEWKHVRYNPLKKRSLSIQ